ncbi:L-histidine N(alpha)-methyltransferase [Magnetospirillum sp. UT-4]|uniref:L-histidine N(alpha)-methyltransferase n=1 Tax=Magnetospirillum sp. UT-4 TaxID=2681467 RepID=UPI001385E264|nr:L-histidine N(alpha)-methyltransferase [Magnetospirillum sp. UT-4]CAA7622617.1 Methyltransferase [Magnetospirillum sp. UT-4]
MPQSRPAADGFAEAMVAGLSGQPRAVPCRYLYDSEGLALFERITELDEYYLSRTETALLAAHGGDIAARVGTGCRVVEFGAGSMAKSRLLLAALERPSTYVPIDIAADALTLAARRVSRVFPGLTVTPLAADFLRPLTLPPEVAGGGPVLEFFPGSTIGNLAPIEARDFLRRAARLAAPAGWLLVGVDLAKDPRVIEAAYDDVQGITAAFVRNLLARANRDLSADFDPESFDHIARWNARESRIEIHLVANCRQSASLAGRRFRFRRGDTIHVEDCYKYSVEQFRWLARAAGWQPEAVWIDPARLFSLHLLALPGGA